MTRRRWYHVAMTLLSVQSQGFFWCLAVFLVLFTAVTVLRLAAVGCRSLFRKNGQPAQKPPEPVYYLVERKKKREKKQYSEPKEISFR